MIKIGINGFGRIGKMFSKISSKKNCKVVTINKLLKRK